MSGPRCRIRSPWQNGYSESFNGRSIDKLSATEQIDMPLKA